MIIKGSDSAYPLTFDEFLEATDSGLYAYYESIQKGQQIEEIFHNRLLEAYNYYFIIGGMPECVSSWIKYKDPAKVSQIQRELIEVYENDFLSLIQDCSSTWQALIILLR